MSIQPEILSKTLNHDHRQILAFKQPETEPVLHRIPAHKPLIRRIKNIQKLPLFTDFHNLVPLFLIRVKPSRLMSAGMENHGCAFRDLLQISQHSFEIVLSLVQIVMSEIFRGKSL